jgi:uncharacterized integral membrane protein (TIGR00697 family)
MNEVLFFIHVFLVAAFILGSVRLGQNGLLALIVLQAVLANLFVVKQMNLFGFTVTCSDMFAVGGILGLNLLQEHFGKEAAVRAVKISFLSMIFFLLMAQIHLWYAPSLQDTTDGAFLVILSATPRIVIASVTVYFLVQQIDVMLFGWLKKVCSQTRLVFRVGLSLVLTQWIDTVLFSFLGLYGLVAHIWDVIVMSFMIKCLIILCSAPLVSLSKRWVRDVSI